MQKPYAIKYKSSHKPGTKYQFFLYFNLLLDSIQGGFVISFSNKEMYLYFQLENILRLFEVMKLIFKKALCCKGDIQPDIRCMPIFIRRLYRYPYKICSI